MIDRLIDSFCLPLLLSFFLPVFISFCLFPLFFVGKGGEVSFFFFFFFFSFFLSEIVSEKHLLGPRQACRPPQPVQQVRSTELYTNYTLIHIAQWSHPLRPDNATRRSRCARSQIDVTSGQIIQPRFISPPGRLDNR